MYYLAYGSNLNIKSMEKMCNNPKKVGVTVLKDHKLECRKYLNVIPSKGDVVFLGVWEIKEEDVTYIDRYEDYPYLYYKKMIDFELEGQTFKGLIYIMNNGFEKEKPTKEYLEICRQGFIDFGIDFSVLEDL